MCKGERRRVLKSTRASLAQTPKEEKMNSSVSKAQREKASRRAAFHAICLAGLLMIGDGARNQGRAAEAEPDPQLGGTPIEAQINRPTASGVQPASALGGEIGQLRSLILNQSKAIGDLKAKLSQQETMIQALQKQR